jgi:hypothetical protein
MAIILIMAPAMEGCCGTIVLSMRWRVGIWRRGAEGAAQAVGTFTAVAVCEFREGVIFQAKAQCDPLYRGVDAVVHNHP